MSKSKSTSASTQSTATSDNRVVAEGQAVVVSGGGTINYLDADVAKAALDAATELGRAGIDLGGDAQARSIALAEGVGEGLLDFVNKRSAEEDAARIRSLEMADQLSSRSFALADEKTQSADDKVFNLGRVALYVGGGLAALLLLVAASRRSGR